MAHMFVKKWNPKYIYQAFHRYSSIVPLDLCEMFQLLFPVHVRTRASLKAEH